MIEKDAESHTDENLDAAFEQQSPPEATTNDLQTITAERDKYLDLARRTRADFENYQSRVRRDWETERKYGALTLVKELLPVLDNLDRAFESIKSTPETESVRKGLEMVRRQFLDALAKHGVAAIRPEDVLFDPNKHEAVMQQPSADKPPMTVLFTVEAGYLLHDRVVRPAKVVVAAALT